MTGKTTNLILLGGVMGVLLGGLLGYIMPNYAPMTDFVGRLIFSALNGIIACVIVAAAIYAALASRGESGRLSTSGAKPFSFFLLTVFIGVTVASVAAASARPSEWTSGGASIPNALILTLAFGAILLGALATAFGAAVAAIGVLGSLPSPSSSVEQRHGGRYDRSRGRQSGGRYEQRDGRSEQHRGGERQHRSGQDRGGRGGHDRGGSYRRERPDERHRDADRTSPFTVSSSAAPSFEGEAAESPTAPASMEQTRPESRPEHASESRSESDRGREGRDGRGGRHYGGGRGRDRDRGPRQYRDRDRRDHRPSRHSNAPGDESSEREQHHESPAETGPVPTIERPPEIVREQPPVFERPVQHHENAGGESPQRHEPERPVERSNEENQVEYGRHRYRHPEHHQPESGTPGVEPPEPATVPDPAISGPVEFGRIRRKRTR
jgi:hypothetical protein